MAEEKIDNSIPINDDQSVLRVLLHNVKGISPVSTTTVDYVAANDDPTT